MNKFFGRILQILNDSEAKRERQIFMLVLALVLSVLLWVLATLNQDYQMQLSYDIAIKDIPEDLFLTKQNSFSLEVNARGPGVDLIVESIRANRDTLFLPFNKMMRRDSIIPVENFISDLKNNFQENTMEIISIKPEFLELMFEEKIFKRVPLRLITKFNLESGYQLESKAIPVPDHVTIYGPPDVIGDIPFWNTMNTETPRISDHISLEIPVDTQKGLVVSPSRVKVELNPRPYTERIFPLKVEVLNEPSDTHVRLSSDTIYFTCLLPLSEYEILSSRNMGKKIFLDYENLDADFPHVIPDFEFDGAVIEVHREPLLLSYVIVSEK